MRLMLAFVLAAVACSPHADVESGSEGSEGSPTEPSGASSGGASSSGGGASSSSGGGASSSSSGGGASSSGGGPDGGANGPEAKCTKSTKTYGGMGMWECVPTGMETKQATPAGLVVAMHGYTQGVVQASSPGQAWGFKATSQWQALAEKHRFYVIYPDKGSAAFQWYAASGAATSSRRRSSRWSTTCVQSTTSRRTRSSSTASPPARS